VVNTSSFGKNSPGLSSTDMSRRIRINRNTAGRYPESVAKLRLIAETSTEIILMPNQNLDILYINRAGLWNSHQVYGKSMYDFLPQKFIPEVIPVSVTP
jgi:hypothetical protein